MKVISRSNSAVYECDECVRARINGRRVFMMKNVKYTSKFNGRTITRNYKSAIVSVVGRELHE